MYLKLLTTLLVVHNVFTSDREAKQDRRRLLCAQLLVTPHTALTDVASPVIKPFNSDAIDVIGWVTVSDYYRARIMRGGRRTKPVQILFTRNVGRQVTTHRLVTDTIGCPMR